MEDKFIYIKTKAHIKEYIYTHFGYPAIFARQTMEGRTINSFLCFTKGRKPIKNIENNGLKIYVGKYSKETHVTLCKEGMDILINLLDVLFFSDIWIFFRKAQIKKNKEKKSLRIEDIIDDWCLKNGIDSIENFRINEMIKQRFYRQRKVYQKNNIDLTFYNE